MTNRRSLAQLDLLLVRFFKDPSQKQKAVLYQLFRSKAPTSLKAIHRELGFGNPYSYQRFLSAKILEDMGLIRLRIVYRGYHRFSIIAISHQKFKDYWPDIEEWRLIKVKKEKKIRKRANAGEQMKRALEIIKDEIKGKSKSGITEIIKGLTRGDFHERGWEITARSLGNLKKRLLKMLLKNSLKI
jgi:hypothetical protein